MKTKTFSPGDKVKLQTKEKSWTGHALESHDPEIILLKLGSGYNIGIRENEILDAQVILPAEGGLPAKRSTSEAVYPASQ